MSSSLIDVAIIGAGPYGLGLAAHLRSRGVKHRIFGSPMETWRDLPENMNLKSLGFATTIPTPQGETFPEYCRANGLEDYEPIEYPTFAAYGMKIQRENVPYVEDVKVSDVQQAADGFSLTLESGERLHAKRVVVAVGLTYFARLPEVLANLPSDRVEHTWGKKNFDTYAGQDVIVIGGGSSALERAVLLHEHGANVKVLVRKQVWWGGRGPREHERPLIDRIRVPLTSLGHGRDHWVLDNIPWLMHYLPASKRLPFTRTHLGPAPAWWLHDRFVGKVDMQEKTSLVSATQREDGKIVLRVREEGVGEYDMLTDRIMAGTGYVFDVDRLSFLSPDVLERIRRWEHSPRLSRNFESSVPGLYFIGAIAAESFGPLVRFVAGCPFVISVLAPHLARRSRPLFGFLRRAGNARASLQSPANMAEPIG